MCVTLMWLNAMDTVVNLMYSLMVENLTLAGFYWTLASAAVLAMVHTLCFIRETKKCNIG